MQTSLELVMFISKFGFVPLITENVSALIALFDLQRRISKSLHFSAVLSEIER